MGPYKVYVRGTSLVVASARANTRAKIPSQMLTLAHPAEYDIGMVKKMLQDQTRESQVAKSVAAFTSCP